MKRKLSKKDSVRPGPEDKGQALRIAVCVFLAAAIFAVYWQVQGHEFLNYDDDKYVTANENVKAGLTRESVLWAFTKGHASNWHPVTWLSHMLDVELFGLDPTGHHLINLFFHAANAVLLFLVLLRMTGALWRSGFVAALFALHPLHVESVAWVAERKDVLSALFWLLTTWTYIRYVEAKGIKRYLAVVLFFALGLMAKPMLVTLPFVLLLLDYWPLRRSSLGRNEANAKDGNAEKPVDKVETIRQLIWEKIPLFALAAASSVTTFLVQKSSGAVQSSEVYPLSTRILNALVSYLEYLEKMVWPMGLAVFYPHPANDFAVWKGVACGVALLCITLGAAWMIRRAPYLAVGWFWYLGTLVPVVGIVQVGAQAMADRYTYLPLIGIFIMMAWGLPELLANWRRRDKALAVLGGLLIPILMVITWTQVSHWKNSITLFKHADKITDKKYPNFAIAYNNLGNALRDNGELDEAIIIYRAALKLVPVYFRAHNNLGIALKAQGNLEEAMTHYRTAIKIKPDYAIAHRNLGNALLAEGNTKMAITHYRTAIKIIPDYAQAHNNLGNALKANGELEEAMTHFRAALKIKPDYATAHNNFGGALKANGELEEAISHYRTAIELKPDLLQAHNNLGNALFIDGKPNEAIAHYKTALRINPDFAPAQQNLGYALKAKGNTKAAIDHFRTAIKIDPDNALAHRKLGMALLEEGETKRAIDHFRTAIKIKPEYALAHNNLGSALNANGDLENAIFHYKAALKIAPDDASAHSNLGSVLNTKGELEEAIFHYRAALKIEPDLAPAHNNLGNALKEKGALEQAIFHYRAALTIQPDYALAHNHLGGALKAKGELEEAMSHYRTAIELKPDYVEAHNNLGNALLADGKPNEAIVHYRTALRIKPDFAPAQHNLGIALSQILD